MTDNTLALSGKAPLQPGDLVDEHEAARLLGVNFNTLRNWRALKKGPRWRRVGQRAVRYHRADLAAFVGEPQAAA